MRLALAGVVAVVAALLAVNAMMLLGAVPRLAESPAQEWVALDGVFGGDEAAPELRVAAQAARAVCDAEGCAAENITGGVAWAAVPVPGGPVRVQFAVCPEACRGPRVERCSAQGVCVCRSGYVGPTCANADATVLDPLQRALSWSAAESRSGLAIVAVVATPRDAARVVNMLHVMGGAAASWFKRAIFVCHELAFARMLEAYNVPIVVFWPVRSQPELVATALKFGHPVLLVQQPTLSLEHVEAPHRRLLQTDPESGLYLFGLEPSMVRLAEGLTCDTVDAACLAPHSTDVLHKMGLLQVPDQPWEAPRGPVELEFDMRNVYAGSPRDAVLLRPIPCPAECSGRGVCDFGVCHCREGFRGAACDSPDPGAGRSLLDLAAERNRDGDLVVFTANFGYVAFAVNAILAMERLGLRNFVVVALDAETAGYLSEAFPDAPVHFSAGDNEDEVSYLAHSYFTHGYIRLVNRKTRLAHRLLQHGYNVLIADVDTYWVRDPWPRIHAGEKADFVFSIDSGYCEDTSQDGNANLRAKRFGEPGECRPYVSAGFYYARATPRAIAVLSELHVRTVGGVGVEQIVLNEIVEERRSATFRELDLCEFRHGGKGFARPNTFCLLKTPPTCQCEVVVAHLNRLRPINKVEIMNEFGLWEDTGARDRAIAHRDAHLVESQIALNKRRGTCQGDCSGYGMCIDGACVCTEGRTGRDCSQIAKIKCKNGGEPRPGEYRCLCPAQFLGYNCSIRRV